MGRGSAAITGSPFMSFYNPASSSFLKGIILETSQLRNFDPYFISYNNYGTYGAAVNLEKYGSFAFNFLHSKWGEEILVSTSLDPDGIIRITPFTNLYILNYSYPVFHGLSIGVNLNYFYDDFGLFNRKGWMIDAGFMKKFILVSSNGDHEITLGLSSTNLLNTKFGENDYWGDWYLPSIMRIAVAYEYQSVYKMMDLKLLKVLLAAEY